MSRSTTPRTTRKRTSRSLALSPEEQVSSKPVSAEEVARRAYELYEARGRTDGAELEDWLQAERQLVESYGAGTENSGPLTAAKRRRSPRSDSASQ
jgi:hypothetical protein